MRAENEGLTLEAFKQTVREQYFSLVLDPEGALAAIPSMLPTDASKRTRILQAIHRTAGASGSAERAVRLAKIEELFRTDAPAVTARKAPRKAARKKSVKGRLERARGALNEGRPCNPPFPIPS